MAGPGALTAMILLAGRLGHAFQSYFFAALIGISVLMLASYLALKRSSRLDRLLARQREALLVCWVVPWPSSAFHRDATEDTFSHKGRRK